jgi:hypothetical protein
VIETVTATLRALSAVTSTTTDAAPDAESTPVVPDDLVTEDRRPGVLATQPQIDAACNDTSNRVRNSNFTPESDDSIPPWSVDNHDSAVTVGTEPSPDGNGSVAQFKSAVVGRTITITQPLTVCPGQQYQLSAINRQEHLEAGCTIEYLIGDKRVFVVDPQEDWLVTRGYFTAGVGVEGASVDLRITASCRGSNGIPVTDREGWMRVEVSNVSVTLDDQVRRRRRAVQVEAVQQDVEEFAALLFIE